MIGKDDRCFICGAMVELDTHHIFGGPNRKHADEDGLTVRLCRKCHNGVHKDIEMKRILQRMGQNLYLVEHSREEFKKRYGRFYD